MNKTKLKDFVRDILSCHDVGEYITGDRSTQVLLDMFAMHPQFEQKSGVGIKAIFIMQATYGSKCLGIERVDGSRTDISYRQCLSGKINKRANVITACREAITLEILEARDRVRMGTDSCPFTGEILNQGNLHIDHYDLKFADIITLWLQDKDIEELYLQTNYKSKDMSFITCFINPYVAESFRTFHNQNTHLRAVSKHANLFLLR